MNGFTQDAMCTLQSQDPLELMKLDFKDLTSVFAGRKAQRRALGTQTSDNCVETGTLDGNSLKLFEFIQPCTPFEVILPFFYPESEKISGEVVRLKKYS